MKGISQNKKRLNLTVVESSSPKAPPSPQLSSLLADISGYKVLVLGDGINDEYVYVRPQGKSPKENIITNRFLKAEWFKGGVWAAAKHVEGFCHDVTVVAGSTITKRRYVEEGYIRKLFEVHEAHTQGEAAQPAYGDFDLVIVTDFGHGAITPKMIERMVKESKYLAVNAQTNSANHGFNLITKYPRADYVVLDELEARLAAHDRDSPIEEIVEKLGFKRIVVTLGPNGAIGFDGRFHKSPGRTKQVVDTMGAGDAFFCVTAPFAAAGAHMKDLLEIGNAAGAIKCGVIGHRASVDRASLRAYLNI
jgi:bifunctional ADP-heptose synthase (sugar kinase/adenylyltransferase)